jgi:hypothetical protein
MRRAALAAFATLIAMAGLWLWRSQSGTGARELIARIPASATSVIGIDVAALRRTGILDRLAGPREMESAEYRKFVADTGFNYRQDLDYVVAGLGDQGNYFVLRGRFNWPALERYARASGGTCERGACRLRTDSGKDASFTLAEPRVLTVSVGSGFMGAKGFQPPRGIAWAVLDEPPELFHGAEKVRLTVDAGTAGLRAHLVAECPDESAQPALAARLQRALQRLRVTSRDGFGKGIVESKRNSVEVTWRLEPAALLSLDLPQPD